MMTATVVVPMVVAMAATNCEMIGTHTNGRKTNPVQPDNLV